MRLKFSALAVVVLALVIFKTCGGPVKADTHQGTLNWIAPGPMPGAAYTYNVKRGTVPGGPYTTVKTGIAATTYVDTPLAANTKYCWVVTVSAVGFVDSVPSNEACATTPQDTAPNASGLAVAVQ